MRILIWFRDDLRLEDNLALNAALNQGAEVIPFFCFDDHYYRKTSFGFPKTGAHRAQFILESVGDLRESLHGKGSELVIRRGDTAEEIEKLIKQLPIDAIYCSAQLNTEEMELQHKVEATGLPLKSFWNSLLFQPQDLPFDLEEMPWVYSDFRKKMEKYSRVREVEDSPDRLSKSWDLEPGQLPSLQELGLETPGKNERAVLNFKGGASEAWKRLDRYFWKGDHLNRYKKTRNGMLGADFSSKFSAWLAQGCISPVQIYHQVKKYEKERVKNSSTYWLIFELIWRDFFKYTAMNEGDTFFRISRNATPNLKNSFEKWRMGRTGQPMIDANMTELGKTGYMSNRGRQLVASYLVNDLEGHWYAGAAWFESQLIDYDITSNYGNWAYVAGVGHDPRKNRYFNIEKQTERYDPNREYINHWNPS